MKFPNSRVKSSSIPQSKCAFNLHLFDCLRILLDGISGFRVQNQSGRHNFADPSSLQTCLSLRSRFPWCKNISVSFIHSSSYSKCIAESQKCRVDTRAAIRWDSGPRRTTRRFQAGSVAARGSTMDDTTR